LTVCERLLYGPPLVPFQRAEDELGGDLWIKVCEKTSDGSVTMLK
jgi:hypothetical protein